MTVALRDRVAVTVAVTRAFTISGENPLISLRMIFGKPAQQGWPEIKTDVFVVINGLRLAGCCVERLNPRVGPVTFRVNAFIPIVERRCAQLCFNRAGPGVLARRLVEMAMNDQRRHFWGAAARRSFFSISRPAPKSKRRQVM